MKAFFLLMIIGVVAGIIDILPMIKMKLDKYSIVSAFTFHLIAPFILYLIKIDLSIWLKGGIFYLLLAIPMMIIVAKEDKKAVPIMGGTSIVIGTIVSLLQSLI